VIRKGDQREDLTGGAIVKEKRQGTEWLRAGTKASRAWIRKSHATGEHREGQIEKEDRGKQKEAVERESGQKVPRPALIRFAIKGFTLFGLS
jgi:hypothetical protein